jgi:tetratricopeptide (TPR) repeat protein
MSSLNAVLVSCLLFAAGNARADQDDHAHHGRKDISTEDRVRVERVIEDIRGVIRAKERSNLYFKTVIRKTGEGVIENLRHARIKTLDAGNIGTFGAMLDLQLKESRQMWEIARSKLPAEEKAKRREQVVAEVQKEMAKIQGMEVMNNFHKEYNEAFEDWKSRRQDQRDWPRGLPGRGHIDDMLRRNPRSAPHWTLSGQDRLSSGDRAGGLADLDRSIALGGTVDAFTLRGALRLEAKDFAGALDDAQKALELQPDDKNALALLKFAEGRSASEQKIMPKPGDPFLAARSGVVADGASLSKGRDVGRDAAAASGQQLRDAQRALQLGDLQAALALAQKALALNAQNAAAYNLRATAYARMGDYPKSIEAASLGLALAPRNGVLLNMKAFAENRSKKYQDALASANAAIEAEPRDAFAYANRAYAYAGLGDRAAMLADLNHAAGLDPRFQAVADNAAVLQLPSGDDVIFLFPGEASKAAAAPASAPARSKSFGLVILAGIVGGAFLALGLLGLVVAPIKDAVVTLVSRITNSGRVSSTPQPASVGGGIGSALRGQYELIRQIGSGGMGTVYEGTDRSLGRRVAIKQMHEEMRLSRRDRERFVIEAKTVASLHHPNIVDIYAIAEENDEVYLVFEFVEGQTVHDLLQNGGRLSPAETLRLTRSIAEALSYAHSRGVIHRDMKPSNVMVDGEGRVKVMDFGIARMAKDAMTRHSRTNTVAGTPPYMAPEQEQGVVRKESDTYSLAICAYEMLTGKLPFIGIGAGMLMNKINMSFTPPSRAIAGLPAAFDEVFAKAFQAKPEQRYHTPQEFAAALEAAGAGSSARV